MKRNVMKLSTLGVMMLGLASAHTAYAQAPNAPTTALIAQWQVQFGQGAPAQMRLQLSQTLPQHTVEGRAVSLTWLSYTSSNAQWHMLGVPVSQREYTRASGAGDVAETVGLVAVGLGVAYGVTLLLGGLGDDDRSSADQAIENCLNNPNCGNGGGSNNGGLLGGV